MWKSPSKSPIRDADMSQLCAVILGIVICYMVLNYQRTSHGHASIPMTAARWATTVGQVVSARKTQRDQYLTEETNDALSTTKNVRLLTLSPTGSKAYEELSAEEKQANDAKVMRFVNSQASVIVFIFAPWCPHCHQALPEFLAAGALTGSSMAIVNGEMCSRELLQGELANVTHFPYVCKRSQDGNITVMTAPLNKDAIVDFASNTTSHDIVLDAASRPDSKVASALDAAFA